MPPINPKILTYLLTFILGGVISYFLFKGETKTIKVPEEKGSFKPQEPIYIRDTLKVYVTKWKTKTETVEIETENPVNEELAQKYLETKDSLEKAQMFLNSIQIRHFKNTFEDKRLRVSLSGEVQGELREISIDEYLIKEREIKASIKRFGIGPYIGLDYTGKVSGGVAIHYSLWGF